MILSAQSIRKRHIISPFFERNVEEGMTFGLGPAGYDVRIAEDLYIQSGDAVLASTLEHFVMPNDILGSVTDKSSWARRFIALQNTVIEPGWRGYLTLEITNHGRDGVYIRRGSPIAQVLFHLLDEPTVQPYQGRYQDQKSGPQPFRMSHPGEKF